MKIKRKKQTNNCSGAEQFLEIYANGYAHGQEDKYRELSSKYLIISEQDVKDIQADAIIGFVKDMCLYLAKDSMYTQAQIFEVADIVLRSSR